MKYLTRNLARTVMVSAAAALALSAFAAGTAWAQSKSKTIVVVLSEEPSNLDGCNGNLSATGRVVRNNIVEGLTEIDPIDGSLKPRLAISWERLDDLTWRFKLRPGVKFHDGAPLNAQTAAQSIARTLDTDLDCETRQKFFGGLSVKGKPVDELTLDLVTDKPVPILPTYMGSLMLSSPNAPMDKGTNAPVGTGAYKFVEWQPGRHIDVVRNEEWWGPKPEAERGHYIWRTESAARAAMVQVGEGDIAPNIAVQDATNPKTDVSYPNSETSWLRIDTHIPPLNDRRVRLALNLAFDREAMRGSILSKDVIPATQAVVSSINGYNPALDEKLWPYDPERAKKLLAEAKADGVPVDREILMYGRTGIYPNATEVMEAFLAWYQELGLNVKLKMLEVAQWIDVHTQPFAQDRGPNLVQTQHDNNSADAVFTVYYKYACEGANSTVCDPELDKKIAEAATLTGDERRKAYQELFRHVYEEQVYDVMMFHMVGYSRVSERLNFRPSIATNSELQLSQVTFK